jgi:hypothetical protein
MGGLYTGKNLFGNRIKNIPLPVVQGEGLWFERREKN